MRTPGGLQSWSRPTTRSGARTLQEAIVACFTLRGDDAVHRLATFPEREWASVLEWLDVSGMALYFLDRMWRLGADVVLPSAIEEALAGRLRRNRTRMRSLAQETLALSGWLDLGGVRYALLKGATLVPHSVPDITLRSQVDLDFLVARESRDLAVHYVRRLGYRLHAETRTALEFRATGTELPTLASLYSVGAQRALELHLVSNSDPQCRLLARRVPGCIDGRSVYSLAPADILVQQARHLLKHLCGEYTRLSWVLEFHRHILARASEPQFWREAEQNACEQENGNLAMGVSLWLASALFGRLPLDVPPQWEAAALPARVRLWLELYARQILLNNPRPTKLYALLRNEVPGSVQEKRSTRAIFFPRYLPARVMDRRLRESVSQRLQRIGIELRFFVRRLRFHLVEGIRFAIEVPRWKRSIAREEQ